MLWEGNGIKLVAATLPRSLFGCPEWIKVSEKWEWGISKHQPVGGKQYVPSLAFRQ